MPPNPQNIQKYLYIEKTPSWKVRSLYLFGLLSWSFVVFAYFGIIGVDPFLTWYVFPLILLLSTYYFTTFFLNLFYRQFNLSKHFKFVEEFWPNNKQPSVDIFLPICGEDITVLRNTWEYVSKLYYKNKKVYVLDDSTEQCERHKELARHFGFIYLERPNKGEMRKAGNLKYAFDRTGGEFIAVFDADFAPHHHFLVETLPYMVNPKVAIVQTPQYFDTSNDTYKQSQVAYDAAYAEEPFYRFIQVTRNNFNGAICCGSNALYRRSSLQEIGGPYQIEHSEDAYTGFELISKGFRLLYIPVILAIGKCPNNYYSFFHQQHRWCMGSMSLLTSKKFWSISLSWKTKLCYISGFLFYLHHLFIVLVSFHLFWVLFLYSDHLSFSSSLLYYPYIIFEIICVWFFPIAKFHLSYYKILVGRSFAYIHAIVISLLGKTVGWVSTNANHKLVSTAFRQATKLVFVYLFLYSLLILLALRTSDIHLFDLKYWSIQFWVFYNLALASVLLWELLNTIRLKIGNESIYSLLLVNPIKENNTVSSYPRITTYSNVRPEKRYFVLEGGFLGWILGISAVLRFYQIGKLPFWNDEAYSFFASKMRFVDLFKADFNMAFFHIIAKGWISLIPNATEGVLRVLPAVLSLLSIPIVFLLGSAIIAEKRKSMAIGFIASFMVALNAFHIQYAQEFRGYSLLFLLTTLSSLFLIKAIQHKDASINQWWFWYIIASITSVYTHFFAAFLLLSQALSLVILFLSDKEKFPLFQVLGSFISIMMFTIPFIYYSVFIRGTGQIAWITKPTIDSITKFAISITGNQGVPLLALYIITTVLGLLAGIKTWLQKDPIARFQFTLIAGGIILPVIMSLLISFLKTPIFLDRYLIHIMPYLAISSAVGIVGIASLGGKKLIPRIITILTATALFTSVITLSAKGVQSYFNEYQKEDWRGASQFLTANCSAPDDLRLYYMIYTEKDVLYYNSNLKSQINDWSKIASKNLSVEEVGKYITDSYDQACLVISHVSQPYLQVQKNIETALAQKFPKVTTSNFYRVVVKVYKQ